MPRHTPAERAKRTGPGRRTPTTPGRRTGGTGRRTVTTPGRRTVTRTTTTRRRNR